MSKLTDELNAEHARVQARWLEHAIEQEAKRKAEQEARNARPCMTVAELVGLLSSMPMDATIVVDGRGDVLGGRMETRAEDGADVAVLEVREYD